MAYHTITHDDRIRIKTLLDQKIPKREIAKIIGCSERALYYDIKKASCTIEKRYFLRKEYSVDRADQASQESKSRRGRKKNIEKTDSARFIDFVVRYIKEKRWSPAACLGYLKDRNIDLGFSCCTRTLYNYIYSDTIDNVRYYHLLRKGKMRNQKKKQKQNESMKYKNLRSIDERPAEVETRETFGHWEMDTVVSTHEDDGTALLVLTERKLRAELIYRIDKKNHVEIKKALDSLEAIIGPKKYRKLFKTMTCDNGTEFIQPDTIDKSQFYDRPRTDLYFCHTYSPQERGSNENQNTMIRRFAPKQSKLSKLSEAKVKKIQQYMNTLPRKILGFKSSWDLFCVELKNLNINPAIFT